VLLDNRVNSSKRTLGVVRRRAATSEHSGVTPPEYLRGVSDEYCLSGPHAHWSDTITRADLLRALQSDTRTDVGTRVDQVLVSKRDETGRAEFITLEGERRRSVRGWDFQDHRWPGIGMELAEEFTIRSLALRIEFHFSRQWLWSWPWALPGRRARHGGARRWVSKDPGEVLSRDAGKKRGSRAIRSSGDEQSDLNLKDAEVFAKDAEESLLRSSAKTSASSAV